MVQLNQNIKRVETIYGAFFSWEGDRITHQLEKYSAHTRNELAMLRAFVREGDAILDLGAHIGTFSIPFSIFNQKKGTIYSFEANPNNYALLEKNIQMNNLDEIIIPTHAVIAEQENVAFSENLPEGGATGM